MSQAAFGIASGGREETIAFAQSARIELAHFLVDGHDGFLVSIIQADIEASVSFFSEMHVCYHEIPREKVSLGNSLFVLRLNHMYHVLREFLFCLESIRINSFTSDWIERELIQSNSLESGFRELCVALEAEESLACLKQ